MSTEVDLAIPVERFQQDSITPAMLGLCMQGHPALLAQLAHPHVQTAWLASACLPTGALLSMGQGQAAPAMGPKALGLGVFRAQTVPTTLTPPPVPQSLPSTPHHLPHPPQQPPCAQ